MNSHQSGSMTIGKQDLVNCKANFQFAPLAVSDAWMIRLTRVTIDNYVDNSNHLVAFRPGQIYSYAPKEWTDVFYYKVGAKPVNIDKTLWMLDTSSGFKQTKVRFFFGDNIILEFDLVDFVIMPNSTLDDTAAYLTIRPNPDLEDSDRPAWILRRRFVTKILLGKTSGHQAFIFLLKTYLNHKFIFRATTKLITPQYTLSQSSHKMFTNRLGSFVSTNVRLFPHFRRLATAVSPQIPAEQKPNNELYAQIKEGVSKLSIGEEKGAKLLEMLDKIGYDHLNKQIKATKPDAERFPINANQVMHLHSIILNSTVLSNPIEAVVKFTKVLIEMNLVKLDELWLKPLIGKVLEKHYENPIVALDVYTALCEKQPYPKVFPGSMFLILMAIKKLKKHKKQLQAALNVIKKQGSIEPHYVEGAALLANGQAMEFFDKLKNADRQFGVDELNRMTRLASFIKEPKILEPLVQLYQLLPENHEARQEMYNALALLYGQRNDLYALEVLWSSLRTQIKGTDWHHYKHVFRRCRHFYRCHNKKPPEELLWILTKFKYVYSRVLVAMSAVEHERCKFIAPKKKKKCQMLVKKGHDYCGEHANQMEGSTRIPCPNDPKHTVDLSQLKSHLKRCNARFEESSYIRKNFNLPKKEIDQQFLRPSEEAISAVIPLIKRVYPQIEPQFIELGYRKTFDKIMQTEATNEKKIGHLLQLSSIIDHLQAHNLLKDRSCVIDLGTGKAQLIFWLAKVAPTCYYLLVDKKGSRNKFENKALLEDPNLKISRLRCSIEHLDLSQVPIECNSSITAICKHFCGNAMDAGIRCVENAIKNGIKFNGFAFASCCHHKCTLEEYVASAYLEEIGIKTAEQFAALRQVSTWAVCNFRPSDDEETSKLNSEKLKLGRQAKSILEFGRAQHLSNLGYKVEIFKYVDCEVSPENLLIVGRMPETANE
ncbi:TRNA:m(4)X modification enzyme TRM13 [Aphelenchoides bicaudatus]|nr:TRNA:m(4)X modification enzyme TRM13 [Aphelenchoides bicaudatus]